jgi:hypothetical protein
MATNLIVQDLEHPHFTSDWIDFGYVPKPKRTIYMEAESRILPVSSENRTLTILRSQIN